MRKVGLGDKGCVDSIRALSIDLNVNYLISGIGLDSMAYWSRDTWVGENSIS